MSAGTMEQQKEHAREMIERLGPEKLTAVISLLEVLLDPLDRAISAAEVDDEPVSEAERVDIAKSREWFEQHAGTRLEQAAGDLGLTMEEVAGFRGSE